MYMYAPIQQIIPTIHFKIYCSLFQCDGFYKKTNEMNEFYIVVENN